MFTTKSLSSIKNALPSIHQPLPLSSKESQKLLNVLKTSFRQNLDKEHGWTTEDADTPTSKTPSSKHSARESSHRRPTDRHLRSILSNPLFKSAVKSNDLAFAAPRDPMDVFEEAAAKGMMTIKAATGCLRAKRQQILQSSALSVHDAIKDSMAGLQVVRWLRSSGEERTLEFLTDRHFVHELARFMVPEGLEEVAWEWAGRMMTGEGPADQNSVVVGSLMSSLVAAKSSIEERNLDTAFSTMIRADQTWKANPQLPQILLRPWQVLSWASTVEAWKRPLPSTPMFESFVSTANHIQRPLKVDRAHLQLHHPTHPDHQPAVKFLTGFDFTHAVNIYHPAGLVARAIFMGMDAVSHLTRLGRTDEAENLLRMLQSKFPEDVWQRHHMRGAALM
ncbi:hypothetical protein CkaCkLH20_11081 [Colletotrichum karsti]|uniref:Uncharacterized protein n=1 Tax=Colletotrichum karsti TaxID=1095194 RepID=A0A9P6HW26_9PEZI|nr:uncharacterized protein CkaCkLH20_11081 [Colletotrichum karsti]KAF9871434.1 hypothetical protein CkaCkLH20_11081 [Colletotrichum karsti]